MYDFAHGATVKYLDQSGSTAHQHAAFISLCSQTSFLNNKSQDFWLCKKPYPFQWINLLHDGLTSLVCSECAYLGVPFFLNETKAHGDLVSARLKIDQPFQSRVESLPSLPLPPLMPWNHCPSFTGFILVTGLVWEILSLMLKMVKCISGCSEFSLSCPSDVLVNHVFLL